MPINTIRWLKDRPVNFHHHVKLDYPETLERCVRCVTGNAIGLVFGGGGARGLSYIGVYKALKELNIPIDITGGTSAGASIAPFCGFNCSPERIVELFKTGLIVNKKAFRYTIPFVSLISGNEWAVELKRFYGDDICIEDLWVKYFCIATNMTQNKINILQEGVLWKAVRASISLPAVVPPISNSEDELLVDGGLVNNLPIDIMRRMNPTGKIIAARLPLDVNFKGKIPEGIISGWDIALKRLNPFNRQEYLPVPNLAEIITNTIMVSSQLHETQVVKQADHLIEISLPSSFKLFDFSPIDKLVEIGYRETMKQLSKIEFPRT
jgi:predicted acylesterase/phospholipase RssA